jgi:GWxTD domain-containing protein
VAYYRQRGLLAHGAPLPFTGSLGFAASRTADSSHLIVALALHADALTFRREGDMFRADYRVSVRLRRDAEVVALADATEPVRVATLRETSRAEESVVFQQVLTVPPGAYALSVEVRDMASGRSGAHSLAVQVPSYSSFVLSAPMPVYESMPRRTRAELPRIVMNPRGSGLVNRDSTVDIYVEAYNPGVRQIGFALRVDTTTIWSDTTAASTESDLAAALARVPVHLMALGSGDVLVWEPAGHDTLRTPVFLGFGDDLPMTTYADMVNYLEYFTNARRLESVRAAAPTARAAVWRDLMRATDPVPGSAENEALRTYFARMRQANLAYGEPGADGWRTDRGMVLLVLGEPDQVLDQFTADATLRGRVQHWEYRAAGLTVVFEDAMGLNRWRLTRSSEALVAAARERRHRES